MFTGAIIAEKDSFLSHLAFHFLLKPFRERPRRYCQLLKGRTSGPFLFIRACNPFCETFFGRCTTTRMSQAEPFPFSTPVNRVSSVDAILTLARLYSHCITALYDNFTLHAKLLRLAVPIIISLENNKINQSSLFFAMHDSHPKVQWRRIFIAKTAHTQAELLSVTDDEQS